MADGPAGFRRGFSCPAVLRIRLGIRLFWATGLLPSMPDLSRSLRLTSFCHVDVLQPPGKQVCRVWANPRSLAATDGITKDFSKGKYPCCFLFLQVLRCFSSLGMPPLQLWIHCRATAHYRSRVPPFGHPRIKACLRLPEAFRRSPRPSSAPSA